MVWAGEARRGRWVGTDPHLRAAADVSPRVVVALAALDRLAPCRAALREAGHQVDGVQLAASRFAELPDRSVRLSATNPVLLLWGWR